MTVCSTKLAQPNQQPDELYSVSHTSMAIKIDTKDESKSRAWWRFFVDIESKNVFGEVEGCELLIYDTLPFHVTKLIN